MEHGSSAQHHLAHLLTSEWDESFVQQWLKEDVPSFDYGGFVVGDKTQEAHLLCKARGVLAGVPFFVAVFKYLGCTVEWHQQEGVLLAPEPGRRIHVATVRGPARKILVGERTALNMLARASGIATLSRQAHEIAVKHNYQGVVAGTRKTTPGFRVVEKYALLVGGCDTHRMDLSSMIMLKDNHVWSSGSVRNAVKKARQVGGFALKIEVECQSEADAYEALEAGADIVMLDNLLPEKLHAAAANVKAKHPHALLEASGGVTMETLPQYFGQHVDVISMGNLTQGVPHIDFSLKIKH